MKNWWDYVGKLHIINSIPNFMWSLWTADSEMGWYITPWWALGWDKIHTQGAPPTTGLMVVLRPQFKDSLAGRQRIIYNWPPSRNHLIAFYDMQGEGCLLLPRSSMGTLLLDLRPEAGFMFASLGESHEEGIQTGDIWIGIRKPTKYYTN